METTMRAQITLPVSLFSASLGQEDAEMV